MNERDVFFHAGIAEGYRACAEIIRRHAREDRVKIVNAERVASVLAEAAAKLEPSVQANPALEALDPWKQNVDRIVREVAELPDRSSPDDWPEAMLVTAEELRAILEAELKPRRRGRGAPGGARAVLEYTEQAGRRVARMIEEHVPEGWLFGLLLFTEGPGFVSWVANADRDDVAAAMRELLGRWRKDEPEA